MKQKQIVGVTVEVEVDPPWFIGEQTKEQTLHKWRSAAETLMNEIKRHCDSFTDVGYELQYYDCCSFCGKDWTEPGDEYNDGCCDKDEDHYEQRMNEQNQ